MSAGGQQKKFAIIVPSIDGISETFIAAHIQKIEGMQHIYHGGGIANFLGETPLKGIGAMERALKLLQFMLLKPANWTSPEFNLYQSLRKTRPDAILVEFGDTALNCLNVLIKSQIPFVTHFHGYDASVHEQILRLKSEEGKQLFKHTSAVVAVSQAMADRLIEVGCPESKLICAPYGAKDLGISEPRASNAGCAFFAVGRFVDKKAPYFTLMAFHQTLAAQPNCHLHWVGDGALLQTCMNMADYLGISSNITFYGSQPNERVRELMGQCDVFVQHSIEALNGDREGSPVAVMEAAVSGLPVVSTRHMGIVETVIHNETGYLVEEKDVHGMAEYMTKLASNRELRRELGAKGREHVLSNFNQSRHLEKIQDVLMQAAGHGPFKKSSVHA